MVVGFYLLCCYPAHGGAVGVFSVFGLSLWLRHKVATTHSLANIDEWPNTRNTMLCGKLPEKNQQQQQQQFRKHDCLRIKHAQPLELFGSSQKQKKKCILQLIELLSGHSPTAVINCTR